MQKTKETQVQSLGWEDPLEKGIPTSVFQSEEPHGQRRLEGYSPWGRKELDTTKQLNIHAHTYMNTHVSSCVHVE